MVEGVLAIILLLALAFWGLVTVIDEALDARRDAKKERETRRDLLQQNIREIIWIMINDRSDDQEDLRIAFAHSVAEYRTL